MKKRQQIETHPLSQEEQWSKLMKEPDPLAETDIYATVKKPEEPTFVSAGDPEETEMDDNLNSVLSRSFSGEKRKQNYMNSVPVLLQ